ncbi:EamA family transporter [Oscillatoria sp. FACHB-1407]|uniref:DMT family transporter n=1 Tax=Oscillatoria sp. FACHB-1407 TaxID=2692847 RepID=UPI0016832A9D|nr:EamA family transporter [Oscillatoria sp. FACHB-1407]MBD2462767.1 EamA family transporter [Oscillatoria sp. FACHB-1407]
MSTQPADPIEATAPATRDVLLFSALCIVWGLTWVPLRIGTIAIPPLLFASSRFLAAGLLLGSISRVFGRLQLPPAAALPRLLLVALFTVTLSYGPIFWGIARIDSGLAAVINLSLIPISLIAAEALLEKRHPQPRQLLACTVGLPGLMLLFLGGNSNGTRLEGIVAVVLGTFAYCFGSVLSRRIPSRPSPIVVSAFCNTVGATLLGLWAIALHETSAFHRTAINTPVIYSWLFLVIFGTIFGFTVYLHLLRVWGSGRAGMYAFLSPIVAVVVGAIVLSEAITLRDGLGMSLMLVGAAIALWKPAAPPVNSSP